MSATHHAVSGSCVFANQLPRFGISGVANYSLSTVRFATHSYRPRLRTVGKRVNHSGLFEFIIEQETRKASPANTLQHCRLRASGVQPCMWIYVRMCVCIAMNTYIVSTAPACRTRAVEVGSFAASSLLRSSSATCFKQTVTLAVSASLAESWKSGRGAFGRLHRRLAKLH